MARESLLGNLARRGDWRFDLYQITGLSLCELRMGISHDEKMDSYASGKSSEPGVSVIEDVCVVPDRDFRIDLFRGLSLWIIFLDHIPENYLSNFTPRNFGFSDAAEILVFLSGFASGFVYGGAARQSGLAVVILRVLRRSFAIYIAQIITIVLLLAEVWFFAHWQPNLVHHANVAVFFADPAQTAAQALIMRYSPVNLDPLLLMVILHFGLIVVLPVIVRYPNLVLAASVALYSAAHVLDWSIPAYPTGELYFDPLNWQLLFVIGVWWGLSDHRKLLSMILSSNLLSMFAGAYILFSLFITLGWRFHSLESYVPDALSRLMYPIDKGNLDILRILHFLALAVLCRRILPSNFSVLASRALRPLIQCGEYSLEIYCASVLLSFAAHAFLTMSWDNFVTQTAVSLAGIAALAALAAWLAKLDRSDTCHPRTI